MYKVVLGDIEQSVVTPETWLCGRDNRGYRLKKENCWDVTWNTQINKVVFTTTEPAMQIAWQYLKKTSISWQKIFVLQKLRHTNANMTTVLSIISMHY